MYVHLPDPASRPPVSPRSVDLGPADDQVSPASGETDVRLREGVRRLRTHASSSCSAQVDIDTPTQRSTPPWVRAGDPRRRPTGAAQLPTFVGTGAACRRRLLSLARGAATGLDEVAGEVGRDPVRGDHKGPDDSRAAAPLEGSSPRGLWRPPPAPTSRRAVQRGGWIGCCRHPSSQWGAARAQSRPQAATAPTTPGPTSPPPPAPPAAAPSRAHLSGPTG